MERNIKIQSIHSLSLFKINTFRMCNSKASSSRFECSLKVAFPLLFFRDSHPAIWMSCTYCPWGMLSTNAGTHIISKKLKSGEEGSDYQKSFNMKNKWKACISAFLLTRITQFLCSMILRIFSNLNDSMMNHSGKYKQYSTIIFINTTALFF